jgi:hypothetical protein
MVREKTDFANPVDVQIGMDALTSALLQAFPAIASFTARMALPVVLNRLQKLYDRYQLDSAVASAQVAAELTRRNMYSGKVKKSDRAALKQSIETITQSLKEFLDKEPQKQDEVQSV